MRIHLVDEESGRLWCEGRKVGKGDLVVTTDRYRKVMDGVGSRRLLLHESYRGEFPEAGLLEPGSVDYSIGLGASGDVCLTCKDAFWDADFAHPRSYG
jgi:hypothetical protein